MTTVQLLVTVTAPDEITSDEAQTMLTHAFAWAGIEAESIVENDGGIEAPEDLALAARWLTLEVGMTPIIKPDRRPGMSANFAAPYGVAGGATLRLPFTIAPYHLTAKEMMMEVRLGDLPEGAEFTGEGWSGAWRKISQTSVVAVIGTSKGTGDAHLRIDPGSRLCFNPDDIVLTPKEPK